LTIKTHKKSRKYHKNSLEIGLLGHALACGYLNFSTVAREAKRVALPCPIATSKILLTSNVTKSLRQNSCYNNETKSKK